MHPYWKKLQKKILHLLQGKKMLQGGGGGWGVG